MVVLSISAVILTSSAALSLAKVSRANDAHNQLQRKWATRTSRNCAFKSIYKNFLFRNSKVEMFASRFELAGLKVLLLQTDEQSKVNINTLAQYNSTGNLQLRVNKLLVQNFMPVQSKLTPVEIGTPYQSLDQIFKGEPADYINEQTMRTAADNITCWGDGQLNFKSASVSAMEALLGEILSVNEIKKISAYGQANPNATVSQALNSAQVDEEKAQLASQYLTDDSNCFGVWVIVQAASRKYYSFHVCQTAKDGSIKRKWGTTWP